MGKKSRDKDKSKAKKKERKRAALLAAAEAAVARAQVAAVAEVAHDYEGRPRSVGATELAARLAGLSTVLQRQLARADAGDGLTRARLSALALLVLGGPRTLGDLAAAERVRPPTMTRLVHAMEADGLVERERHPSDGRSIIISATALGETRLESGRARQIAPLAEAISEMDRGDRNRLDQATDLLGRVLREAAWEADTAGE